MLKHVKKKKYNPQSSGKRALERDHEMIHMLVSLGKDFKESIMNTFKDFKRKMVIRSKLMREHPQSSPEFKPSF